MKIKSVDNFSLDECREYLDTHPAGSERTAVEDRLYAILQQKRYSEEQIEIQKKLEQERIETDVSWIDFKQFVASHKYRDLLSIKGIFYILIVFSVYFISVAFVNYNILDGWCYNEDIGIVVSFILFPSIIIGRLFTSHSSSLKDIYNIEQDEKTKSIRRTQNRVGKFGLHLCKKRRIIQLLPIEYDNIYYCGGNSYVCVKGNKCGAYNALTKKMVIDIEYDSMEILKEGVLLVTKNGVHSKFTTDGYRVIE